MTIIFNVLELGNYDHVSFPFRTVSCVSRVHELVHYDVWEPINIFSTKFQYFFTAMNNCSRMTCYSSRLLSFESSVHCSKLSLTRKSVVYNLIMSKNICRLPSHPLSLSKTLLIKHFMHMLHNKMELPNAKIIIC